MTDEPEDTGQISVAELLERNGQQVASSGGRRRRGATGGISVAELTGEIPVYRDASENRNLAEPAASGAADSDSGAAEKSESAQTSAEPSARTESAPSASASSWNAAPAASSNPPSASAPAAPSSPSTQAWSAAPSKPAESARPQQSASRGETNSFPGTQSVPETQSWNAFAPSTGATPTSSSSKAASSDYDDDDDDEPIASRPQLRPRTTGRSEGATPRRDQSGSWASRPAPTRAPAQAPAQQAPAQAPVAQAPVDRRTPSEPSLLSGPDNRLMHRNRPAADPSASDPSASDPSASDPSVPSTAGAKPTDDVSGEDKTQVAGAPVGRAASRAAAKAEANSRKLSLKDRLAARAKSVKGADDEAEEPRVAPSASAVAPAGARPVGANRSEHDANRTVDANRSVEAADAEHSDEDTESGENTENESSSAREWALLVGQGVVAIIAGALLFKGFEKLWDMLPWVALILALLVIVGLVAMVRILRRTDDITSFVIAVVVGMIVTLGPLAFMLASG
ncbi:hypothetical protein [Rhodococcus sp. NPDC058521]|uniref:hypothetical protein n=1 Tax=Rhodococcus sp. NPDC058521 TaxID=3346536 RepID=UPI003650C355